MTPAYQICAEHPDLTSPDKRLPCPACLEKARADKAEAAKNNACLARDALLVDRKVYRATIMRLAVERDAALAKVERLRAALHAASQDLQCCSETRDLVTGDEMTWKDSRRIANRAAIAARDALNPTPELWPCGHEKVPHDEVCRECSP